MRNLFLTAAIAISGAALTACSNSEELFSQKPGNPQDGSGEQVINISVSGTGGGFATRTGNAANRELFSALPGQSINYVKIVIAQVDETQLPQTNANWLTSYKPKTPAGTNNDQFTCKVFKTYDDWMQQSTGTDDRSSSWKLTGDDKLTQGTYIAYAVGCNGGNYTEFDNFIGKNSTTQQLNIGKNSVIGKDLWPLKVEKTNPQPTDRCFEIFGGMTVFEVNALGEVNAQVNLERQIAGALGYFRNIPAKGDGQNVGTDGKYLRLVSSKACEGALLGDFNQAFRTQDHDVKYVMNGFGDFDASKISNPAKFADGTNAVRLYQIDLTDWFTANSDGHLDTNGDGVLDKNDDWHNALSSKSVTIMKGAVLGSSFVFPFQASASHATLELQLLDASQNIIRHWEVNLPASDVQVQDANKYPEILSYTKGSYNYSFATASQAEAVDKFSFLRNHIYCIGKRIKYDPGKGGDPDPDPDDPDPGKDDPTDLSRESILTVVNGAWETDHQMELK